MPAVIYIHGFNSSPASFKAKVLREALGARNSDWEFIAPALPPSPRAAGQILASLAHEQPSALLVGSSLGGFYATWMAENFGMRAVLVNPAVRPYELLAAYVGPQKNLYTAEEYEFTNEHLAEMRVLEPLIITPERYFLMVTTGDEVLDYRAALKKYHGAQELVVDGGDHGFSSFGAHLDAVWDFAGERA